MTPYKRFGSLLVANLLLPIGVIVFIVGFFRGKPPLSESVNNIEIGTEHEISVPVLFDKVIFMMVDALRSDFVFSEGSGFQYTQQLIRSGKAMPFTARAASPTLTLSRIKALTRGTSQSFLDVWLNVFESENARSLAGVDTWLSRLKTEQRPNKKMVFYGADLWLDMYSDIFDRFEGTDAWYLPEFDSVDSNVTRKLPEELGKDDWKALILHYLGLDNIAHQGGPQGPHMLVKQTEMDAVAKLIYEALEEKTHLQDTLFILLGDHGMTEQGNHGGGSTSEIASAMVFISPKFMSGSRTLESPLPASPNYEYYSVINQIDLVPTIAGLMGFTTPSTSLGVFPADMLDVFTKPEDRLRAISKNALQLKDLLDLEHGPSQLINASCHDAFEAGEVMVIKDEVLCAFEAMKIAQQKLEAGDDISIEEVLVATRKFCEGAQRLLNIPPNNPSYLHLAMSATSLSVVILILILTLRSSAQKIDTDTLIFGFALTLHASSLFMNQFVTEEHRYWYWGSIVWLAYLGSRMADGKNWLSFIVYPAALQFLSQSLDPATNPQYSVISYVHDQLYGYQVLFWVPGLLIYASGLKSLSEYVGLGRFVYMVAGAALCAAAVFFRLSSSYRIDPEIFSMAPAWFERLFANINRNLSLNIFWTGLAAILVIILLRSKFLGRLSPEATLIATIEVMNLYLRSITRSEYLVLFPIFDLQFRWLLSSVEVLSPSTIAVTSLFLGQSAFFASGHGNSFSSFDLTNGFNGIESSRTLAVALQALLSNYFGPVWWALASLRLLHAWRQAQTASRTPQDNGQAANSVNTKGHKAPEASNHQLDSKEKRAKATQAARIGIEQVSNHGKSPFVEHMALQSLYTAFSSMAVVAVCLWRRNDLTLWTVLTPKCLNVILWVCFEHFMINIVLSTALWGVIVA